MSLLSRPCRRRSVDDESPCRRQAGLEVSAGRGGINPTRKRQPYEELVLPVAREKRMGILAMKVMGGGLGSLAEGNPIENDGASNHDEASRQAPTAELICYVLGLPISAAVIDRLLNSCPKSDGVTFRCHSESGIPQGSYEFRRTIFDGVVRAGKKRPIDTHGKGVKGSTSS